MTAPVDFHQLLQRLAPLGWVASFSQPGLYLPPGDGGPLWIRDEGPGWVSVSGRSGVLPDGRLLVTVEIGEVEAFVRERVRT